MYNKSFFAIFIMLFSFNSIAQKKNDKYNYFIKKTNQTIKIDGKADEKAWENAETAADFFQVLPMDTSKAKVITEVKFTYDKKNLYLLFINHNFYPGANVVESMKRDWNFGKNDNDLLFFDTFNDLTNGFTFGSNARGGQWDGLLSGGSGANLGWDNKWKSEVSFDKDKWVWEAAIPFKTLRYKSDIIKWGLNMSRLDLKTTEKSAWAPVPRQFPTASLAFTGNLVWDSLPPAPGKNISIIPFVYASRVQDFGKKITETPLGIGFDAKIGITSSINMDLSVLPDFSQVEVDVQQTNLDRFELFFPERRQFFLENGDIFNNFGNSSLRPFFSRRIGLTSPMVFGAKVSGKINKDWRIGLMNLQTGNLRKDSPGANYSVLSVQRQVFKRSYISALYTDKNISSDSVEINPNNRFNRTLGLEYNLASADNKWQGKAFFIKTFVPTIKKENNIFALSLTRLTKNYTVGMEVESVDDSVKGNEVGFIRRVDYNRFNISAGYLFFPKGKQRILSHGPQFFLNQYYGKKTGLTNEYTHFFSYRVNFRKQDSFTLWTALDYVLLLNPFDPTGYTRITLPAKQKHTWASWGSSFVSRPQNRFSYGFDTRYGGYYTHGKRLRIDTDLGYRFQPYMTIGVKTSYNKLQFFEDYRLPEKLKNTTHNLWLVGPRIDLTLSNKIFFTNFVQYNNQSNNFNIITRFQWRYSPASDLFLVYTDNYYADNFKAKNRALVLKFTYWWNV
jgi:Domain of unknown function (DUF5916)/Carbohydrate family 9 binding domain-like